MTRLIQALHQEWKDWAASLVPRFLGYRYFDRTLYGDVNAFISTISARFMTYGAPPPEWYEDDSPDLLNGIVRAPPPIPQDDPIFFQINSPPRTEHEPRESHQDYSIPNGCNDPKGIPSPIDDQFTAYMRRYQVTLPVHPEAESSRPARSNNGDDNENENEPANAATVGRGYLQALSSDIFPALYTYASTSVVRPGDEYNSQFVASTDVASYLRREKNPNTPPWVESELAALNYTLEDCEEALRAAERECFTIEDDNV